MKTVSVISQKGGAGKTTLALHLAAAATAAGLRTLVVDLDPQQSAFEWGAAREAGAEPAIIRAQPDHLAARLKTARERKYRLAIVDTPPSIGPAAEIAAEAADLVLVPCRPSLLDLRAIGKTADMLKAKGVKGHVVLNAVPPRATQMLIDAFEAAALHGLDAAPIHFTQRAAYANSLGAGHTAMDDEGKAADEIGLLFHWLSLTLREKA